MSDADDILPYVQFALVVFGSLILVVAYCLGWRPLDLVRIPVSKQFDYSPTTPDVGGITRGLNAIRSNFVNAVRGHSRTSHSRACLDGARQAVAQSNYFQSLSEGENRE
jgi:hypothetical protein